MSISDAEGVKRASRWLPVGLDVPNKGQGRSLSTELNEPLDLPLLALGDDFDPPIREVPNPSGETEPRGLPFNECPIVDSLDPARYVQVDANRRQVVSLKMNSFRT